MGKRRIADVRPGLAAGLVLLLMAGCAPIQVPTVSTPSGAIATAGPAGRSDTAAPALPSGGVGAEATGSLGWKTYTDADAGYSISLPPGTVWRAGKSKDGSYTARMQFQVPGVPGYQGMVIRVEPNPGQKGLEQILAELYQASTRQPPPADLLARTQELTIAGVRAVKLQGSGDDFTVVVPYSGKTYFIAPVHDLPMRAAAPEALQLFEQALATFAPAR